MVKTGSLVVRMFGELNIEYNGEPIRLPSDIRSITVQFLLLLWIAGEAGINRDTVLNRLYGDNEVDNPANSMRVNVHRLRKLVAKLPIPEQEYIATGHGGYWWDSGATALVTDIQLFTDYLAKAKGMPEGKEKQELLKEACDLYKGEFLTTLAAEHWAAVYAVNYQKMYVEAVTQLYQSYMSEHAYEEAVMISDKAMKLYGYESFAIMNTNALRAQGYHRKALNVLEEFSQILMKTYGVTPSEELMELYEEISRGTGNLYMAIQEIKKQLNELRPEGAYYCSLAGFTDCYRVLKRLSDRSGLSVYLLNCSLMDAQGNRLSNDGRINESIQFLMRAIESSLRKADVYTRSRDNQCLILLANITLEDCSIVTDRITRSFHSMTEAKGIRLDFQISSALE